MQEILTFKRDALPKEWLDKECGVKLDIERFKKTINSATAVWQERKGAELNSDYKQLIPYAIFRNGRKIACYRRSGDEKRLHKLYSVGIGGHIDREDERETIFETINLALNRELSEELRNFSFEKATLNFVGIINDESSEVSAVHLGLVFLIESEEAFLPGEELTEFDWLEPKELAGITLEKWSQLALEIVGVPIGK